MASQGPMLASSRVAPLIASFSFTSVGPDETIRDAAVSKSAINFLPRPEDRQLHHYSSQLRIHLQWRPAARMPLLVFRNFVGCAIAAVIVNGCYYMGNIFSFKPSVEQSRSEFLMATMVWTAVLHALMMIIAHLPFLTAQQFVGLPDGTKPSLWFCTKKLVKGSRSYFAASLVSMIVVALIVQHTSLMHENFKYKLHFYLGNLCNLTFTTGITIAVRKIYREDTYQGRDRRKISGETSEPRNMEPQAVASPSRRPYLNNHYKPSFWREYVAKFPNALLIAWSGGFVHVVSWYRILDQETIVIMLLAAGGVIIKLALQEGARQYVLKNRIRSVRTMCVLVGVPTVLIDTQSRIVLLGTQTNTFLVAGTFVMAVAEICLRAGKAAFIAWTIRCRAQALEQKLLDLSANSDRSGDGASSPTSLKLEFELWRRQVLSYHTAELTADMYAEYIAISCSQSIVFWLVGHPLYPALRQEAGSGMYDIATARWRFNQVAMLGFQFLVEIFVDYVCVVMEMAAGIDFNRIESLSAFLGVLFMMIAALNINISSALYLC
ncbi:unnamed protein product [Phytophthora lilii]|uniref:Unnamed protein product n=1 Tax=Phytophthora lilii TaxID=2077276 RepID=A0A9W6WGA8_9STRA|nr:unnamed protein product [Phytophthora lilii]